MVSILRQAAFAAGNNPDSGGDKAGRVRLMTKKKIHCAPDFVGDAPNDPNRIGTMCYVCTHCEVPLEDNQDFLCDRCQKKADMESEQDYMDAMK